MLEMGIRDPRREGIGRNPVRTFHKDRHAIHNKGKRCPIRVRLLPQTQRAQPNVPGAPIKLTSLLLDEHRDLIQRLLPISVGPPQLWIRDGQGESRDVFLTFHDHRCRPTHALWRDHLENNRQISTSPTLQVDPDIQSHSLLNVSLAHVHIR